jgi:hypothetical protein
VPPTFGANQRCQSIRRCVCERNRKGQARISRGTSAGHGDLARVRADVRVEARAALGRLADHYFGVTLTKLIEELAAGRERSVLARLRPDEVEVYLADDPELLAHLSRAPERAREPDPSSQIKRPARVQLPGKS